MRERRRRPWKDFRDREQRSRQRTRRRAGSIGPRVRAPRYCASRKDGSLTNVRGDRRNFPARRLPVVACRRQWSGVDGQFELSVFKPKKNLPPRLFHCVHNRRVLTAKRWALRFDRYVCLAPKLSDYANGFPIFRVNAYDTLRTIFANPVSVPLIARHCLILAVLRSKPPVRFAKRPGDRQIHDKPAETTDCAAYNDGEKCDIFCDSSRKRPYKFNGLFFVGWRLVYVFSSPSRFLSTFSRFELVPFTLVLLYFFISGRLSLWAIHAQSSTHVDFHSSNLRREKHFVWSFSHVYTMEFDN